MNGWKRLSGTTGPEGIYEMEPNGVRVEVKASPIHGLGLFASQFIEDETLIGLYQGQVTFNVHEDIEPHTLICCAEDETEWGIEGEGPMKFMNHADEAAVDFDCALVYADRDIDEGEEITMYYGEHFGA